MNLEETCLRNKVGKKGKNNNFKSISKGKTYSVKGPV